MSSHPWMCCFLRILAVLSLVMLIFNMAAIPVFEKQVFWDRGPISPGPEMLILAGFVVICLFNLVSVLWGVTGIPKTRPGFGNTLWLAVLGLVCLALMMGEKIMVDEIGREYQMGWETTGEWIVLYGFFFIQLFCILLMVRRIGGVFATRPVSP